MISWVIDKIGLSILLESCSIQCLRKKIQKQLASCVGVTQLHCLLDFVSKVRQVGNSLIIFFFLLKGNSLISYYSINIKSWAAFVVESWKLHHDAWSVAPMVSLLSVINFALFWAGFIGVLLRPCHLNFAYILVN